MQLRSRRGPGEGRYTCRVFSLRETRRKGPRTQAENLSRGPGARCGARAHSGCGDRARVEERTHRRVLQENNAQPRRSGQRRRRTPFVPAWGVRKVTVPSTRSGHLGGRPRGGPPSPSPHLVTTSLVSCSKILKMLFLGHDSELESLHERKEFIDLFFPSMERFGSFVSLLPKSGIPFLELREFSSQDDGKSLRTHVRNRLPSG